MDHGSSTGRTIAVDARIVHNPNGKHFAPGAGKTEWFRDHEQGPEMVVVPAGSFVMGSSSAEEARWPGYDGREEPQHFVTIQEPFTVGRHAITRGQFAGFVKDTGHSTDGGAYLWNGKSVEQDKNASWRNSGFAQDDGHPVVCTSWHDANAYCLWLSKRTGKSYRLLSEAEREYVTRAGTTSGWWWGNSITSTEANFNTIADGFTRKSTVPVESFRANPWGLFNVHGNVSEWCADVWHGNYYGAPSDGSPWLQGGDTNYRVARGGSWADNPMLLRSADRVREVTAGRLNYLGFRVARSL